MAAAHFGRELFRFLEVFRRNDGAKRPPRGFDPGHALIEDIKRKDFVALARFTEAQACSAGFLKRYLAFCRSAAPLNAFLARALMLSW